MHQIARKALRDEARTKIEKRAAEPQRGCLGHACTDDGKKIHFPKRSTW
jgi:hypothetical protein